ncbi:MAG: NAD(P)H-dependent oxidoreductase [Myxococcota bacterium]
MATLLHIDCSVRMDGSITRELSASFVEAWRDANPRGDVIVRDLGLQPPSPYSAEMMIPSNKPRDDYAHEDHAAMAESDRYLDELQKADFIVAGVPMYNFMVPSTFKAWIDQVVIAPRAFTFDPDDFDGSLVGENGFRGLLTGKKMAVLTSRGCDYRLPQNKRFDLLEPYLRVVFEYIGITDMYFVDAHPMVFAAPGEADEIRKGCKRRAIELARGPFSVIRSPNHFAPLPSSALS